MNLDNWFSLPNMQSKLNLSHSLGDLNDVQLTGIKDMHEQCVP